MDRARHGGGGRGGGGGTVWVRVVQQFLARGVALGVPRALLLRAAGVAEHDLLDADARLPLAACYALLEATVGATGDPLATMRMTRALEFESFDALACAVMTSPTVRDSIAATMRYQRIWSDGERYTFDEHDGFGRIGYTPWGPPRPGHRLMAEMFAVDVAVNAAALSGPPFDGVRVQLRGAPPADPTTHRELLGGIAAEFGQPHDAVWIPSHELDRRMAPAGREAVFRFFERHLDAQLSALPDDTLVGRARDLLVRDLAAHESVGAMAKALRLAPRTLQRQLAAGGTSLRRLADEVRRSRALSLLDSGHAVAEVSWLCGFAEPTVFHRAFRRWTGTTPQRYRRRAPPDTSDAVGSGDRSGQSAARNRLP